MAASDGAAAVADTFQFNLSSAQVGRRAVQHGWAAGWWEGWLVGERSTYGHMSTATMLTGDLPCNRWQAVIWRAMWRTHGRAFIYGENGHEG